MRLKCCLVGLLSVGLILGQLEGLLISGLWVINSTIQIHPLTRVQLQEFNKNFAGNSAGTGTRGGILPLQNVPLNNNDTILTTTNIIQKLRVPGETVGHRFQIGTALCIVWVIVGLKIIFCCTIVLTHEPKPKPLIINHKHLRIQQCPVGNLRICRRDEGNLVHLPEEEEEDEEEDAEGSKGGTGQVGQESTTPPPPYSSLRINL